MEALLYIAAFLFLYYFSICFRLAVSHPIKTIINGIKDFYKWLKYRRWNECKTGQLIAYVGLFGKGKTLSAVHYIVSKYNQYNNKKVFDFHRMKWVTQKVYVISNVELSIPFEYFVGLAQVVQASERFKAIDEENDTLTCIFVLGDEFSVQLNSRQFKNNIDPLFLNTLLTCRHHHISLIYTSQRFNHVDALLRQVTSFVVTCNKCWRFMVHGQFDAFALENATDPTLVKPLRRFGWFIENKDYNAYDTLACVENLKKSCQEGDMLTESEILALQANNGVNMDAVVKPSREYVRSMKKRTK
uniref:hypothetical protein n=1 Tax=Acetatifactor sp. TaxID=1872090 RepID=UPI004056182A